MERKLEDDRPSYTSPKPLEQYVGTYIDATHNFLVEVHILKHSSKNLQIAFQGLKSQVWDLRHYEGDTFLWLTSRDEQARQGRFTYSPTCVYKIIFVTDPKDGVVALLWPHDPSIPEN